MAFSLNKVQLIGHLGKDPEIRATQDGRSIATLNLATSESWNDKSTGQRQERTEWHRVVIFNKLFAEVAQKYLHKGSKVYVEGQLQTRKWTDQQGQERYTTEIVLGQFNGEMIVLDSRQVGDHGQSGHQQSGHQQQKHSAAKADGYAPEPFAQGGFDDDIPF